MSNTSLLDRQDIATENTREFLTITIANQIFGIPVLQVQDVLGEQKVTRVPLAPAAIGGSLNLRGRIVTAIDVRTCLGLPPNEQASGQNMSVVVEHGGELYSLMIDKVGDVLSLPAKDFESNPATLDPKWRNISQGIYRLKDSLLVVLDVPGLLQGIES
jgi:purine-binding chemotaxis protein CheW